ncbi:hypothetical protein ACHAAC_06110 [Aeromicrobium sp. CF4.19]|uniref:hypothetical protein n=1 Tax=Aeromicrobium sp. CF4.19 TaxID=3373082 RepID=UPI003EE5B68D
MPEPTQSGFGRVLVAVYAVFALAATARSVFQLVTKAGEAPLAYALSALAGLVYVLATVALATDRRRLAAGTIGFELIGVVAVGTLSALDGALFPDQTVWSVFGAGYGYVPLLLPLIGVWWLYRTSKGPARSYRAGS